MSQSDSDNNNKSRTKTSVITSATGATAAASHAGGDVLKPKQRSHAASATASGSESSIPEEVPSTEDKKKVRPKANYVEFKINKILSLKKKIILWQVCNVFNSKNFSVQLIVSNEHDCEND